jgi:hypothetical protein
MISAAKPNEAAKRLYHTGHRLALLNAGANVDLNGGEAVFTHRTPPPSVY